MTARNASRILIVGGGIGGLTLAAFLQRHHCIVTLVERAEAWRPVGAGLLLGPNAIRVLDHLGVGADVRARGVQLRNGCIADVRGRILSTVRLRELGRATGLPSVAIHRAELHAALLGAIDQAAVGVRLGSELEELRQTGDQVEAAFVGGGRERYDLVVGADGINSFVRSTIAPHARLRYAGHVCWRFVLRAAPKHEADAAMLQWGRGKQFGVVPIGGGTVYCFASANVAGGRASLGNISRQEFVARFSEFGGDAPRMLDALDDSERLLLDDICDLQAHVWRRGRIALLGDAAHASTPNLAQGAAMAIEDAMVLAGALVRLPIADALERYESVRRVRVARVVSRSRTMGRIAMMNSRTMTALRDFLTRIAPDAIAQRSNVSLVLDAPDPEVFSPPQIVGRG